jgi:hypothetical protein
MSAVDISFCLVLLVSSGDGKISDNPLPFLIPKMVQKCYVKISQVVFEYQVFKGCGEYVLRLSNFQYVTDMLCL